MNQLLVELGFCCLVAVLIIDKIMQWMRPSPVHVVYSVGTQTDAERRSAPTQPPSDHPPSYEDVHRVRRSPDRPRRNEAFQPRADDRSRQTPLHCRVCLFCRMPSHGPLDCPIYPTAEQRENILRSRGACRQCCHVHPNNIPGRGCPETRKKCGTCRPQHIDWLCPNRRKPAGVAAAWANVALRIAGAILACAFRDRNNDNINVAAPVALPDVALPEPEIPLEPPIHNNEE